jgi:hypothetical protein
MAAARQLTSFLSRSGAIFEPQKWNKPIQHFDIRNSLFDILRFKISLIKLSYSIIPVADILLQHSWRLSFPVPFIRYTVSARANRHRLQSCSPLHRRKLPKPGKPQPLADLSARPSVPEGCDPVRLCCARDPHATV